MDAIVITGMGAVTPVGVGVDAYWQNLLSGRCGIGSLLQLFHHRIGLFKHREYLRIIIGKPEFE